MRPEMPPEQTAMSDPTCIHCGKGAAEHHEFQSIQLPPHCQCDPLTWAPTVPKAICGSYHGNGIQYCRVCEHNRECHGEGA